MAVATGKSRAHTTMAAPSYMWQGGNLSITMALLSAQQAEHVADTGMGMWQCTRAITGKYLWRTGGARIHISELIACLTVPVLHAVALPGQWSPRVVDALSWKACRPPTPASWLVVCAACRSYLSMSASVVDPGTAPEAGERWPMCPRRPRSVPSTTLRLCSSCIAAVAYATPVPVRKPDR